MSAENSNPLLKQWNTAFNLPPFDQIQDMHFREAFDVGLAEGKAKIEAIANNPEAPNFENTIEALELSDETLDRALGVFFGISGPDANDEREAIKSDYMPKLSQYSTEIIGNAALFERVQTIWNEREYLDLSEEQQRVLYLTHRNFTRAGAALSKETKKKVGDINAELATLGTQFSKNLLADEKAWSMPLDAADLKELPDFVLDSAKAAAQERGLDEPIITLSRPLAGPFLTFSSNRNKRRELLIAMQQRGANGGDNDNRDIAVKTLKLRDERSKLLGYETYAHFKLETQMAKTPENVRDLLMKVWEPAKKVALEDESKLQKRLNEDGYEGRLEPWDWAYYSNLRKKEEHDLDAAMLKPYLQLDKMLEASFSCATKLFDLSFEEIDVPLYHSDARAWNVTRNGAHIAIFIGDYFARSSKRSGAWCMAMRSQQKLAGDIKPIVLNVCNFAKGAEGKPSLLSYNDARTLFHEFGHALHQILSDVRHGSISGTSVARDFVELPSQLYEHWLEVPEVLEEFAIHADTGEAMPEDLVKRLLASQTYDQGYMTTAYVASSLIDLDFHEAKAPDDVMQAQAQSLDRIGLPHAVRPFHLAPHFQHIFAGEGYSAGYYSYMWSEVMDADAFEAFKEGGYFNKELAKSLQDNILSRGGSDDPELLYKAFRGRMPGAEAMLKGRGLL